jgi:hypothetical protein
MMAYKKKIDVPTTKLTFQTMISIPLGAEVPDHEHYPGHDSHREIAERYAITPLHSWPPIHVKSHKIEDVGPHEKPSAHPTLIPFAVPICIIPKITMDISTVGWIRSGRYAIISPSKRT